MMLLVARIALWTARLFAALARAALRVAELAVARQADEDWRALEMLQAVQDTLYGL